MRYWPTVLGLSTLFFLGVVALAGPWLALVLTTPLLLGAFGWGWWAAERRSRRHAGQAKLLSEAIMTLGRCRTDEEIYQALPVILSSILDFTHAEVLRPAGDHLEVVAAHRWSYPANFEVPLASITGRAYRSGDWQYVADTARDPEFVRAPDAALSRRELALPLVRHGTVIAVLNVESARAESFTDGDLHAIQAFSKIAEEALLRVSNLSALRQQVEERSGIASLNHKLLRATSAKEAARFALEELQALLGFTSAVILQLRAGHFRALATLDSANLPERYRVLGKRVAAGIAWQPGNLQSAWLERRAIFVDALQSTPAPEPLFEELGLKAAAFVPISDASGDVQALLAVLPPESAAGWSDKERRILTNAADTLGLALERAATNGRLRAMLEVVRQLAQTDDPNRLYQGTVEAAVQLVPDSETASILVRAEDGYRFCGVYGCGHELLDIPPFTEAEMQDWYALDLDAFRRGTPRILRGDRVAARSLDTAESPAQKEALLQAGKLEQLRANLCVPISVGGEVIGILNLDSLTRDDAFDRTAIDLAEAFAQQIAVIIRQAQYRETLEQNALTDVLTGLGNRAGFNQRLTEEMAGALRNRRPFSLIVMDLNGFKAINDSLGHLAGDQALVRVAEALRSQKRAGDSLYRWGGDEFAIVLPATDHEGAELAAERYLRAVRQVHLRGLRLDASLGIASCPDDGETTDGLLKRADDLMYQRKAMA